jgi:hypothetical protein
MISMGLMKKILALIGMLVGLLFILGIIGSLSGHEFSLSNLGIATKTAHNISDSGIATKIAYNASDSRKELETTYNISDSGTATKIAYTRDGENFVSKERVDQNIKLGIAKSGDYKEIRVPLSTVIVGPYFDSEAALKQEKPPEVIVPPIETTPLRDSNQVCTDCVGSKSTSPVPSSYSSPISSYRVSCNPCPPGWSGPDASCTCSRWVYR